MLTTPTPPASFIRTVRSRAPLKTISENWGRRLGCYGDEDECTRLYRAVLVYIEQGLGAAAPLFEAVSTFIDKVQPATLHYVVLPLAFGNDDVLHHDGKAIALQGGFRYSAGRKFVETCVRVAGETAVERPYVPALFPPTDLRGLYQGKVSVDRNDLLLFLVRTAPPVFSPPAAAAVRRFRKQAVVVEYESEAHAEWSFLVEPVPVSEP